MKDPYLYDDVEVLKNKANIKNEDLLCEAEAAITALSMIQVYNTEYDEFNFQTLCDIHKTIFCEIYDWAGQPRTIQIYKSEVMLNGQSVRYIEPFYFDSEFKKVLSSIEEIKKNQYSAEEFIPRLAEVIATIWKIHPFREGNTRTTIAFCVLFVRSLGYNVDTDIFKTRASFVRHALVRYHDENAPRHYDFEYILGKAIKSSGSEANIIEQCPRARYSTVDPDYKTIDGVDVSKYKTQPHKYIDSNK